MWLRIGTDGNFCEHGNEPSGDVTGGEGIVLSRRTLHHGVCFMRDFGLLSLFWDLTRRRMAIGYRLFRTSYRSPPPFFFFEQLDPRRQNR
jgi:hypothetical protein